MAAIVMLPSGVKAGHARAIVLSLFAVSWMLTHLLLGLVVLEWYKEAVKSSIRLLVLTLRSFDPQLRNSLYAPGYDGECFVA